MEKMFMPAASIEKVIDLLEFNSLNKIEPIGMFLKYGVGQGIYIKIKSIKNNNFELLFLDKSFMLTEQEIIQSIKNLSNNIDEDKQYYLVLDEFDINSKESLKPILELIVLRHSEGFSMLPNINFILMAHNDILNVPAAIRNKFVMFEINKEVI